MPTNFLSAPTNQFEASTSRAPMSNRIDEPIISSSSYFVEEPRYDNELEHRLQESGGLDPELIEKIRQILDAHNPFVKIFRQLAQRADIHDCRLLIREKPGTHLQYTLPTSSQVAAILVGGEELMEASDRDIIVQTVGGELINIKDYAGYYDPLQYPLLLPYGTYGWYSNYESIRGRRITCCDYYAYMLQIRGITLSIILHGGRLLQQYVVDNYVKIEAQKLRWIRFHQNDIRAELYEGLQDCLNAGENNADIFLTMTCNPSWKEIKDQLLPGQTPQDRPDLLTRIFRAKYEELKEDIFHKGVLGKTIAHVHVIEFQKRGLPHVHMLVIFDEDDKLNTPEDYDCVVRAEIPDKNEEPELYAAVLKHMIHGPSNERNSRTMLTEFFKIYIEEQEQNMYLYKDFPKYYRWLPSERKWLKRSTTQKVIGRVYAVAPSEGERFYLRLLLNHVTGPKSFDDLLTVDGVHYLTFKQAAEKHGLLEDDNSIRDCLVEARSFRMPSALRRLFATILLYCEPSGVRMLWEENYPHMIEDYPSSSNVNSLYIMNKLLHDINDILQQHKRSIKEFDLPQISEGFEDMRAISDLIEHELSIPIFG
ncbi:UNVERIFIED_CONTAM: hypothetical protein Sangu_2581200 [Sesamum angustifolium]|uniref:Helitron helicase-like domain-containing protein n=1 Tax=Sesamum angustifolium TaxID=2727405 RepID=A0AAW2J6M6_9LAMI